MKTKVIFLVVIFLATITLSVSSQEKQDYKILFEKAKYAMETKGNLNEAIGLFESLIKTYPQEKEIAANSQLLIGICFEKLGLQTAHSAREAFQKVLKNYPKQSETVQLAKTRLQNLNSQTQAKKPAATKNIKEVIARKIYSDPGFYGNISPDGKYLSYVDWDNGNMGIHNLETGKKRLITNMGTWKPPTKFGDESLWSPDGKSLAYFWIFGNNSQLRVQNIESGEDRILAENTGFTECPWPIEWTKDGKYLLCASSDELTNNILQLVSVKDGSAKTIYNLEDQCPCGGASLSPDGKYIVASLGRDLDARDIHIFSLDGSYKNKLVSFSGADWAPKWTPDGQKVIFASKRSGNPALWIIKVKEGKKVSEPRLIYEGISEDYYSLNFTNDGKFVFRSSYSFSNIFHASIKPEEGIIGESTSLTNNKPGVVVAPFWSPDGNKLAYISRRPDNAHYGNNIIIHDLKTGKEEKLIFDKRPLELPGGWEWPQWSADGKSMLLQNLLEGTGPRLFNVNIETGEQKRLRGHKWKNFGPGNTILYIDSLGNKIIQLTISSGKEKVLYKTKRLIYHLTISQDKTTLAFFEGEVGLFGAQQDLYSLQLNDAEPKLIWKTTEDQTFSWYGGLNFFPDGETLLLALKSKIKVKSNKIKIQFYTFNINKLVKMPLGKELRNYDDFMNHVRLSPDGKKIAYSKSRNYTNVWTLEFDY